MKCYGYETETDFVLCVEGVNDPRLKAAIQHAWFAEEGEKFVKKYPMQGMDNGVTKADLNLVKENFARLGKSMFRGMLSGEWESALLTFAQKCKEHKIEWYIIGSVSDALHGVKIAPQDIDIIVHTKDFFRLKNIFPDAVTEPFVDNKGTWLVRFFGRLCLSGTLLDIAADEKLNLENHDYDTISWKGFPLYIENFKARYGVELSRGRKERIAAMEAYMSLRKST